MTHPNEKKYVAEFTKNNTMSEDESCDETAAKKREKTLLRGLKKVASFLEGKNRGDNALVAAPGDATVQA